TETLPLPDVGCRAGFSRGSMVISGMPFHPAQKKSGLGRDLVSRPGLFHPPRFRQKRPKISGAVVPSASGGPVPRDAGDEPGPAVLGRIPEFKYHFPPTIWENIRAEYWYLSWKLGW